MHIQMAYIMPYNYNRNNNTIIITNAYKSILYICLNEDKPNQTHEKYTK